LFKLKVDTGRFDKQRGWISNLRGFDKQRGGYPNLRGIVSSKARLGTRTCEAFEWQRGLELELAGILISNSRACYPNLGGSDKQRGGNSNLRGLCMAAGRLSELALILCLAKRSLELELARPLDGSVAWNSNLRGSWQA